MKQRAAIFPAVMTAVAFVCFVAVYLFVVNYCIVPPYVGGLLFALPCVVLGIVTLGAYSGKLRESAVGMLTGALSVAFVLGAGFWLIVLGWLQADSTTDTAYYERVLARTAVDSYAEGLLPRHIPDNAENVVFCYCPPVLQGGETFVLAFQVDAPTIATYEEALKERALWSGTHEQAFSADKNVLCDGSCVQDQPGYGAAPDKDTVYLLAASPENGYGHNHALSYTATVNRETNTLIFHYGHW